MVASDIGSLIVLLILVLDFFDYEDADDEEENQGNTRASDRLPVTVWIDDRVVVS